MKPKYLTLIFAFTFIAFISAQTLENDVLFTVDDTPVKVSEFLRVYKKNLNLVQDESQKDVDEYLKLFTNYKLKLKEARAQGFHKKPTYQRELESYKKQLSQNYMTDNEVNEALVKEAYQRITEDVRAAHILVRISEGAAPEDTLTAYKQINELRKRAIAEGFETVRKDVHNGQTLFGEDLGWFTGFKMVYKFENAAYETPVGEISQPFRTRFGYHIVHVLEKRKAQGERTVRHIMIIEKNNDSLTDAKTRVQEIYKKIQQGENFEALAKEFSDDKNSALNGGLLNPFSSGQLSVPEFEEAAFALEQKGDISEPLQSKFGWHIIKLESKNPIGSFEDKRGELENKVKRDSRSKLIEDALIQKLKNKYNIADEHPDLSYFKGLLNEDFFKRTWTLPKDFKADIPLVKIGEKQLLNEDFGEFLVDYQNRIRGKKNFNTLVPEVYEAFLSANLKQYQEDNLENDNEDYAHILGEYRDGLLLFDLMESTIWQSAKTDSVAVENFYKDHKDNYFWPVRAKAVVASSPKKKVVNKVAKLMKKNMAVEAIKNLVNTNGDINVIFTIDTMSASHQALPKEFDFKTGVSKIYKHNDGYIVTNVSEILPKAPKAFEEVKGLVMSDYQTKKEELWLEELRGKYKVVVNEEALKSVKAKLKT
ncbi:peptidylprolyl isomerase [Flavobacteriaceae bacterium MHTCC 0001]